MQEGTTAAGANNCADEPCDLYRFFDAGDRLLYVGISKELPTRWRNHGQFKGWWTTVVRATIEHYGTRAEAEQAETHAIATEHPLYNVRDAPERQPITAALVTDYAASRPAPERAELTPSGAAALLSVSPATIRRWGQRGILTPCRRLPGSRHRRYDRAAVEALRELVQDPAKLARLMGGDR